MSEPTNHLFWLPDLSSDWRSDRVVAKDQMLQKRWLLFTDQDGESWFLPLSHLISYSRPPSGPLELKFTTHCMKLDCGELDVLAVVDEILKGSVSLIGVRMPEELNPPCLFVRGLVEDDPRDDFGTES